MKILSRDGNSQSSNVLTTTEDEVALSLVPIDVYADMVTDICPYFLKPNKYISPIMTTLVSYKGRDRLNTCGVMISQTWNFGKTVR